MEHTIWTERYRPKTIDECILPAKIKNTFKEMISKGEIQNMLLSGTAGLGKTTVAKALCHEFGLDYLFINGSEDGNIDVLRGKIKQFATTVSLTGNKKVVILDEADYLNPNSTQPALRAFMEQYSDNCRFILTCNYKNKIIEALHSRCSVYEFNTTKKDLAGLSSSMHTRIKGILDKEEISYTDKVVAEYIMKYLPDWRRTINEIQRNSLSGTLVGVTNIDSTEYNALYNHLKKKDFTSMRKWVVHNLDVETSVIFRNIYDRMGNHIKPQSIPQLVLILADYSHKGAFAQDPEINIVACLTEIMGSCEFL